MKQTKGTLRKDDIKKVAKLHLAFELSHTKWKLAFSDKKRCGQ